MGGQVRGFGWTRAKEMARESLADLTAEQGRVDVLGSVGQYRAVLTLDDAYHYDVGADVPSS